VCLVCAHLISDGRGIQQWVRELLERLEAPGAAGGAAIEALPPSLETQLGDAAFALRDRVRAFARQLGSLSRAMLLPGALRLPFEARCAEEHLESRYQRIVLEEERTAQLDRLCLEHDIGVADLAAAAFARAIAIELGHGERRAAVRSGRSFCLRRSMAPAHRDALQSSVVQAGARLPHDPARSLVDLAVTVKRRCAEVWEKGHVLDGVRALRDGGPALGQRCARARDPAQRGVARLQPRLRVPAGVGSASEADRGCVPGGAARRARVSERECRLAARFERVEDLEEALPAADFERLPLPWEAASSQRSAAR
jgi:hypothetical protein